METKHRYALRRVDGIYVNLRYEPVRELSKAARFPTIEDYQTFITGHYKPPDASQYVPQMIEITYKECDSDGRELLREVGEN